MRGHDQTYDALIAMEWEPTTGKGVTTRRFASLSLCLYHEARRMTCVQGYGPTPLALQVDAATEAKT